MHQHHHLEANFELIQCVDVLLGMAQVQNPLETCLVVGWKLICGVKSSVVCASRFCVWQLCLFGLQFAVRRVKLLTALSCAWMVFGHTSGSTFG